MGIPTIHVTAMVYVPTVPTTRIIAIRAIFCPAIPHHAIHVHRDIIAVAAPMITAVLSRDAANALHHTRIPTV